MKSLVWHPATRLTLDFSKVDFGGPEQEAVIADWLARREANLRPLARKGDFVCVQHRDHENPSLELRKVHGQIIAAHWKGSMLDGSHEIVHGVSPEHQRQVEYVRKAGEAAGFRVEVERFLPTTQGEAGRDRLRPPGRYGRRGPALAPDGPSGQGAHHQGPSGRRHAGLVH